MIKYIMTSETAFTGEATLTYDENGERPAFNCLETSITPKQHEWTMRWICDMALTHENLVAALKHCNLPNLTFKQITFEPTFADFWTRYFKDRYKDNSSKRKSEQRWNRMSKGEQLAAYNHIGKYFVNIPSGTNPKYAETYLNSELWNN